MKKLVLFAAAAAMVAFASCGGNKGEEACADSTAVDSAVVAEEVVDSVAADSVVADSVVADSAAVVAE